ncbi:MAG: ribosome maturation factor RimP [Synechococcales bacterium]|nr:ribosome maturation factor RimP [Synechococcales bacterium]
MTHPLIPQVLDLATPVAENLGLELVGATFHTNQNPPVLRVDVRNVQQDTSLDDCEAMSHALEAILDQSDLIPDQYVLEISSPGISRVLETEREFVAFKGFPVRVTMAEPFKGQTTWSGQLVRRDEESVHLSRKGRAIAIPRSLISQVQLDDRREDQ